MTSFETDLPLGSGLDPAGDTWFRVFAPRATAVVLHAAATPDGPADAVISMTREWASGTWAHTLPGNRHGLYYWFTVDGPPDPAGRVDAARPLNDPYAAIALSSFGGTAGRSMVFDFARLGAPAPFARPPVQDLVLWEVHVADLTGSPTSGLPPDDPRRGRFAGFATPDLRGPATRAGERVRVGLDHIAELGVNAVQLLPTQEFPGAPGAYDWGYYTANFFSPAGAYASTPVGEGKAHELRALVDALHARGIAVVLDIVLNHTAEGGEGGPTLNFRGFDPRYYYRRDPVTGAYRDGSGVGNELATEQPMVRRFVIDCLRFWVERYGVDGFRFDLAGLLDLETVRAIARALPGIYLYGEPWALSGALWGKGAVNAIEPWFVFNDEFRDTVKGSPEGRDGGFVQGRGSVERLKAAVSGNSVPFWEGQVGDGQVGEGRAWAASPLNALNYLDCHDNLTLADKLSVSLPGLLRVEKESRVKLAATLLLTSLGPVLLHAGVEFLRTKPYDRFAGDGRPVASADGDAVFDANSYRSGPATNHLDWRAKAENVDLFRFWQGLIALRRSALGRPTRPPGAVTPGYFLWFEDARNPRALGWELNADGTNGEGRLRVFVNASGGAAARFATPFPAAEGWRQVADEGRVDLASGVAAPDTATFEIPPLGIRIFAAATTRRPAPR